jgi:hypothetical protein
MIGAMSFVFDKSGIPPEVVFLPSPSSPQVDASCERCELSILHVSRGCYLTLAGAGSACEATSRPSVKYGIRGRAQACVMRRRDELYYWGPWCEWSSDIQNLGHRA